MSSDQNQRGVTDASAVGLAVAAIVLVIAAVAVTAWLGGRHSTSPRTTTVTRASTNGGSTTPTASNVSDTVTANAHDFVQFACAQYHKINGVGSVSPDV